MKYEIELDNDAYDTFEQSADNVAEIKVYTQNRQDITNNAHIEMFLSRNALLGLGTELIRMAHKFREGKHVHLEPVDDDMQVQRMGIFLTPNSSKVMICCSNNKCIDEYL